MTWTNAYTIGACTTTLWNDDSNEQLTSDQLAALGMSVSVADGVVTVTVDADIFAWQGTGHISARVTPSYSIAGVQGRLVDAGSALEADLGGYAPGAAFAQSDAGQNAFTNVNTTFALVPNPNQPPTGASYLGMEVVEQN